MGEYRAKDVFLLPGLLSLSRIPLAAAFPWALSDPVLAIGILCIAGLSDVLDGWTARRYSLATATGAVIDGLTDKIFVLTVAVAMVAQGYLTVGAIVLLSTREIGELPLVVWWATHGEQRRRRAENPRANVAGKVATLFQFFSVALALVSHPWSTLVLWLTAALGAIAALLYWHREIGSFRRSKRG